MERAALDGMLLASGEANPEPGRVILNFAVDDARTAVDRLEAAGTRWIAELEDRDGSLFATATDPDGNYIQVIQMHHEPSTGMPSRRENGMSASHEPAVPVAAAFSSFSVDSLGAAEDFYGAILGLPVTADGSMVRLHLPGGHDVLIYDKPDHRPASFTVLNLLVPDIERAVGDLVERGIRFEHYEGFDQDQLGIDRSEPGPSVAWFTDPAGNVLSLMQPS